VLDLAGIMFSSIMMVLVVMKAVQLDRIRPWFEIPASLTKKATDLTTANSVSVDASPSWRTRGGKSDENRNR